MRWRAASSAAPGSTSSPASPTSTAAIWRRPTSTCCRISAAPPSARATPWASAPSTTSTPSSPAGARATASCRGEAHIALAPAGRGLRSVRGFLGVEDLLQGGEVEVGVGDALADDDDAVIGEEEDALLAHRRGHPLALVGDDRDAVEMVVIGDVAE